MKFLVSLLLTALLAYASALYLPWWIFAITSCIVAVAVHQRPFKAFLSGFLGVFILWIVQAFLIDQANEHILSGKVALMLQVGNRYVLLLITGVIGGLISGFAALTGCYLRKIK